MSELKQVTQCHEVVVCASYSIMTGAPEDLAVMWLARRGLAAKGLCVMYPTESRRGFGALLVRVLGIVHRVLGIVLFIHLAKVNYN